MALTVEDVREFIRDHAEANFLTDEVDFTPEQIARAIKFTVADFNAIPVITTYSDSKFPFINILLYGVVAWLLRGLAVYQTRNQLDYSTSGGVQVNDFSKGGAYASLADSMHALYERKAREVKNQLNIDQGWGSQSSEYFTNRAR